MKQLALKGKAGVILNITGKCIARVEALNHDDSVRRVMCLYKTNDGFVCQRIDNPSTIDERYKLEHCADVHGVYQSFGTEPLANYLYGCAGLHVPGLRRCNVEVGE